MIIGNTFTYTLKFIGKEGLQQVRENFHNLTGDIVLENKGELRPASYHLSMEHSGFFWGRGAGGGGFLLEGLSKIKFI